MNKITKPTKISEIKREWHLVDIKGKILGIVAGEIALLLAGKSKPNFVRNLDCGDYVVIVNAKEVAVTGKKEEQKKYYRHSGYPHGFRTETLADLREDHPERIITHAVSGMLPQTRLKAKMLKRLFVFDGPEHKYQDKFRPKADKKEKQEGNV
jgi:large subunit ribosomal protein L13